MPLLTGLPIMLIGAHAAAVYAAPRYTVDVDLIVAFDQYAETEERMRAGGWTKSNDLVFPGSHLGLIGGAWSRSKGVEQDIMTSAQDWLREAFAMPPVVRDDGQRVIPRDYLILMKMDSARGHDQGDLTRILGRMTDADIEQTVAVLKRHLHDESAAQDVRHFAEIGRWEYETGNVNMDDGRRDDRGGGGR